MARELAKAAIASLLAGAMVATSIPAQAQASAAPPARDRDRHRDDDGIDVGEVIAGALVIAGIAAILSRSHDRDEWRRNGGSRRAIELCVNAAEQRASQGAADADVTRITRINRTSHGYDIRGEIEVYRPYEGHDPYGRYDRYDPYGRYERSGRDDRYGRYGRYDRYGRPAYADYGTFRCKVRYGEVRSLKLSGLD